MQDLLTATIRIDSLKNIYQLYNVEVDVLRLDEVHPVISGNKWFKLKEFLKEAEHEGKKNILTFGGAWSNHILATAAACKIFNYHSIGIIRGEEPERLSHTLQDAIAYGMKLFFTSRSSYSSKDIPDEVWQVYKKEETLIIPEGGYSIKGCIGASEIHKFFKGYNYIVSACGTGTTLAGLVQAAESPLKQVGISVLKNHMSLRDEINNLLAPELQNKFDINHDFHFGGYAKTSSELISFMNDFYTQSLIPTDIVYTGKMFYAADHLIKKDYFSKESKILIIHSGGLQGNRSLPKGTLIF